jgi:hypothetical protein
VKLRFALLCLLPIIAQADTLNVGVLSYDTFVPGAGGIDAFDITNLTGSFNLPPDFPVLDNLIFQSAALTLSDGQVFMLGNIAPGLLLDANGNPVVQVPASSRFQSAELRATLSATTFAMSGGTFTANSNMIDILLLPSTGVNLTPDVDTTTIAVTGQASVVTPEPASWALLLIVLPLMAWLGYRQHRRPSKWGKRP